MTRMAPNYDQHPFVALDERADECVAGWEAVVGVLADAIRAGRRRVVIECYCGVFEEEVTAAVARGLPGARVLRSADAFRNRDEIARLVAPFDGGDDPLFGWLCGLRMEDFLDEGRVAAMRRAIDAAGEPVVLVGCGASVVHAGDLLVHADLPRWEGQLRMRRGECENLGAGNRGERWTLQVLTQAKGVDVEPHTFNVSSETVFNAQVPTQPGRYILVGPAPVGVALGTFGERLQKRIIEQYLGPQAAGVRPVQAGSSTFMQRFMIFASEPARVPDLVTPGFEAWMTRWEKHKPVAKLTPDGLEIRLADVALKQPEDLETLVEV